MRSGDPLRLLLVLFTAVPASTASVHRSFNPSTATCSAPIRTQLDPAPLSSQEQDLLKLLLPQPSSEQPAVRGELRAPFHIPCQLASFPHLQSLLKRSNNTNCLVKEFAQPPHLIFFDENQHVVQTIVVSPTWTGYELRELIQESMGA
ncbi:Sep15/SelM redox [Phytophthora cactorum]|nr:Sep15/SelM redox [Phytophthora cactorum]